MAVQTSVTKLPTSRARYTLRGGRELRALPLPDWRVRNVLPTHGLAMLYGQSGIGKSFVALDMGCAIAEGRDWFGYKTSPTDVIYIVLEAQGGFPLRTTAWEQRNQRDLPERMRVVLEGVEPNESFNITIESDVDDMAHTINELGADAPLVIIDTLNCAAPGVNENSPDGMGMMLAGAKRLQRQIRGLVMVIHHPGKDGSKGPRGHNSLYAGCDAVIEVGGNERGCYIGINKLKEGEDGLLLGFQLEKQVVGAFEDGEHIVSCVVSPLDTASVARKPAPNGSKTQPSGRAKPSGANQVAAFGAVTAALRASNDRHSPDGSPSLPYDDAVAAIAAGLQCEEKRRNERAKDSLKRVLARGALITDGENVWLP